MSSNVIEAHNLVKKFHVGDTDLTVVNDVSFEIKSGEFAMFFGPSGCGKSTLLNVICGLEKPSSGKIKIRGESLGDMKERQLAFYRRTKIGIVFQQFNLLKTMSNKKNVALPLIANGEKIGRAMHRAEQLLKMVGLEKHVRKRPTEISGGQQQRVAIARALSANPWIIVADEPTGNLDSHSADEVVEILNILNQKSKRTIIMVTHNPDYLKFADVVFHLKDGQITKTEHNHHKPQLKDIEGFKISEHAIES